MLEVFNNVEATGEQLIVTDHGKPVLHIFPIREKVSVSQLFSDLQGQALYHEDVDTPTINEWSDV